MTTPEENPYRPELPPVPKRMQSLPIRRGYPVPFFVAMVDGEYHFPTADSRKMLQCLLKRLCWVCGKPLGAYLAFTIGPMCAINRISSEPPSHLECAEFSARACPFLVRPKMKRVQEHPEGSEPPPGIYLERNPGVTLIYITRDFTVLPADTGPLFSVGDPLNVIWYAEGRAATRAEVMASIDSGLPLLKQYAVKQGPLALIEMDRRYQTALKLVPA